MFKATSILLATCYIFGASSAQKTELGTRIHNGYKTNIELHPWQIEIKGENGIHYCGGSIYSKNIVITAAHCLEVKENWKIFAGTSFSNSSGSEHKVVSYQLHESYSNENDIAVLRVTPEFNFNNSAIQSIPLAEHSPNKGVSAVVTGWGRLYFNGPVPLQLQALDVHITDCRNRINKKSLICIGVDGEYKGACDGDSGGPLVYNGTLVGVLSRGDRYCNTRYPEIFSDVAYYRLWIENTAERLSVL